MQWVKQHRRELGKEIIAAWQNGHDAKIRYEKQVIDYKVYCYDDESETSVLVRDNNIQKRGHGVCGSLFMGSADYGHHLGHAQCSANQDESGSLNGDDGMKMTGRQMKARLWAVLEAATKRAREMVEARPNINTITFNRTDNVNIVILTWNIEGLQKWCRFENVFTVF